jgi:hypothetical protein
MYLTLYVNTRGALKKRTSRAPVLPFILVQSSILDGGPTVLAIPGHGEGDLLGKIPPPS